VHSNVSGYSNENGSGKSRIKKRILTPERSPTRVQPSHFRIDSANFNSPKVTNSSGQRTEKVSIYSENPKIIKKLFSSKGKSPNRNITYVRTYTNAQLQGNRITRRDPQFDSDNTFDNFESNNMTCKDLSL
jgi:ABC-type antimicrobial peptide transport system ATPase subunit